MNQDQPTYRKILAIDTGQGTQDILLFDVQKNIENCISLILPSPTSIYAKLIEESSSDLYIHGSTIGGSMISQKIKDHIIKGFAVFMEPEAAASIRDNLDTVRSLGITVGKPQGYFNGQTICFKEVNLSLLREFLAHFGEELDVDIIALAVQDHGVSPEGKPDRLFRFEIMGKRLQKNNAPEMLGYWAEEIPAFFTRMTSAVKSLRQEFAGKILVMDTALCAILGCMDDSPGHEPCIIINVGNDHTLCAIVNNKKIDALLEHHTAMLTSENLRDFLIRFARGEVTNQEVFEGWGHGALYINKYPFTLRKIIVTGPNRNRMLSTGLPVTLSAPGGNMMLTGPLGLIKACQLKSVKEGLFH